MEATIKRTPLGRVLGGWPTSVKQNLQRAKDKGDIICALCHPEFRENRNVQISPLNDMSFDWSLSACLRQNGGNEQKCKYSGASECERAGAGGLGRNQQEH